ncbi:hypothetical protein L9F63_027859, partial [Diploptera punctata]
CQRFIKEEFVSRLLNFVDSQNSNCKRKQEMLSQSDFLLSKFHYTLEKENTISLIFYQNDQYPDLTHVTFPWGTLRALFIDDYCQNEVTKCVEQTQLPPGHGLCVCVCVP